MAATEMLARFARELGEGTALSLALSGQGTPVRIAPEPSFHGLDALAAVGFGLVGGVLLALWHFGGLWITLRLLPRLGRPRRIYALSSLARFGLTLAGFHGLLQAGPPAFLAALASFTVARLFMAGLARPAAQARGK